MVWLHQRIAAVGLACALVTGAATCSALEPGTPLARLGKQAWSVENGLPQNTVTVLLQTRSGYLYAGTESGLARFDGMGFRIFDHASGFPDAEIRCLLDASGNGSKGDDLWVGTADGLVRLHNEQPRILTTHDGLPNNSIRGLARTADGTVWVWTEAGLARAEAGDTKGERFVIVPLADGQSGSSVTSLAAEANGDIWVGTTTGAAVWRNGAWESLPLSSVSAVPVGQPAGLRGGPGTGSRPGLVAAVPGGDVLIAAAGGVFLAHGGVVSSLVPRAALTQEEVSFLTRLADGTVAVASKSEIILVQPAQLAEGNAGSARMIGRFSVGKQLPGARIESAYADREGCLWVGTNRGLARIAVVNSAVSVESMPTTDPLAASAAATLLEDREGDLWVGTEASGLHILRDARFRTLGASDGLAADNLTAIVQDARKTLWIGSRNAGLSHMDGLKTTSISAANGLLSNVVLALAAGQDGAIWVGTPDGLNRIAEGHVTAYTSADGLPDDFIRSLLVAPDDSLWIGTRRGLTHFARGRFQTWTHADGLGSDLVGALAWSTDGDLWVATLNGLSRLHAGKLHNYTTADGLSSNVITALAAAPQGMLWVGTQSDGLDLWDGQRFVPLPGKEAAGAALMPTAIHAILDDGGHGHLWLATESGLSRVETQALLACAHGQACALRSAQVSSYTTADGLRGRETSSNSHPTAARDRDGRLWFTSPRGVIVVDPVHFPADPPPPPAIVERFAVDDRDQDVLPDRSLRIGAGGLRFQFDYAGLSFAAPHKVRYQYMLEGFDHAWTDAGTRRTAYYTNIPPGNYRFRVRTAMEDAGFAAEGGTFSRAGSGAASYTPGDASLAFVLAPHYYQTWWFRALAVVLIVLLVLLIFRRRVLRVEREFRAVMAERNRIAREIHDTLAQGYVGISLQLEILGELLRLRKTEAAQGHLQATQQLVRDGLNDARQSIWALRSQDAGETTLPVRLRRHVDQARSTSLDTEFALHGAYRALSPEQEQEILRIGQEAIHNVLRHAAASRMTVRLEYDEEAVQLMVTDNGKGFVLQDGAGGPDGIRQAAHVSGGHYGLIGIQERAAVIHAKLCMESEPGSGTSVRLTVPAAAARKRGNQSESPSENPSEIDGQNDLNAPVAETAHAGKENQ